MNMLLEQIQNNSKETSDLIGYSLIKAPEIRNKMLS